MNRIGIDLGTTNTVIAAEDRTLALASDGSTTLPSVVAYLPNGRITIGSEARRRRSIDGPNTIFSSKRIIGRQLHEPQARRFQERYPFELVEAGEGLAAFRTRAGDKTPEDVACELLTAIHERIASVLDEVEVVITVPTGFGDAQRDATRSAARRAGFADVRLVDEPDATACAYLHSPDASGRVAVYDLGGGTFDISVLDLSGGQPQLLAKGTDPYLGGDDIDLKIAEWVTREVLKEHNWDLTNYSEVEVRLIAECERAKIRLTDAEETFVDLSQVDPECPIADGGVPLRRPVLDGLSSELVQRTFVTCDDVLHRAGVRASELTAVLLAGGTTHLPVVRRGVEAYFGRAGHDEIEPTEVVARGASCASADLEP
ncbi:MAG: Hsp70 family protein [Myxococcota bacterium]